MDNVTLKKKLSTYVSEGGYLRNVSDEVLYEVLLAWEEWTGTAKEFYRSIGFSQKKMATLLGKAKKLKREGHFGSEPFKEIKVEDETAEHPGCPGQIELLWQDGKVIRFPQVSQLLEFVKKAS
jgi:hypothetical protein